MKIRVKVRTNAPSAAIKEAGSNYYEVSVTCAPIDGKANKAVIEQMARHLVVAPSTISLIKGAKGKEKILEIP